MSLTEANVIHYMVSSEEWGALQRLQQTVVTLGKKADLDMFIQGASEDEYDRFVGNNLNPDFKRKLVISSITFKSVSGVWCERLMLLLGISSSALTTWKDGRKISSLERKPTGVKYDAMKSWLFSYDAESKFLDVKTGIHGIGFMGTSEQEVRLIDAQEDWYESGVESNLFLEVNKDLRKKSGYTIVQPTTYLEPIERMLNLGSVPTEASAFNWF